MKTEIFYLLLGIVFLTSEASAGFYGAPVTDSNWSAEASKVKCALQHEIPDMGVAIFSQLAGKALSFELRLKQLKSPIIRASLAASAPAWMHETAPRKQHNIQFKKVGSEQSVDRLIVYKEAAETMLDALKSGWFPRFTYVRKTMPVMAHETQVAVSAVNFRAAYEDFRDCRQALLPFAFDDIRENYLFYGHLKSQLSPENRQEVSMISEYLSLIPSSSIVMVPSQGEMGKKAKKRFNARVSVLNKVFAKKGIKAKQIKNTFKGLSKRSLNDQVIQLRLIGSEALRMIFYSTKKALIGQRAEQRLGLLARFMKGKYKDGVIVINGHTDSKGSSGKNMKLSEKRIGLIKRFLVSKGIASDRIRVKAWGERKPVSSNRSRRGRANNRRVQIDFIG